MGDGDRIIAEVFAQVGGGLVHASDGVADDQHAPALVEFLVQACGEGVEFVVQGLDEDVGGSSGELGGVQARWRAGDCGGDERVGGGLGDLFVAFDLEAWAFACVGLGQFTATLGGQGGGQDDDRDPVPAQPGQGTVEVGVHVRVVGVRLVDDDDLAGERQVAQGQVFALETGEEELVDGAHGEGGEHALLAAAQPAVCDEGRRAGPVLAVGVGGQAGATAEIAGELLVEVGLGVGEEDGGGFLGHSGKVVQPVGEAGEHGVAGGHGGQRDEATAGAGQGGEDLRREQGRLGLALAHGGFDDHQSGAGHVPGGLDGLLLHGTWTCAVGQIEARGQEFGRGPRGVLGVPLVGKVEQTPGRFGALGVGAACAREVGEVVGVAGDPVGGDDQGGEQDLGGLGELDRAPGGHVGVGPGDLGGHVQEFGLDLMPGCGGPRGAQEFGVVVECGDGAVGRWDAVMTAGDDGELVGVPGTPTVLVDQPVT